MRYLKLMGLAALMAAALTALLGAGTASATVLCKNNTSSPCSETYASGTVITGKSTDAKLKTDIGTVECAESVVTDKTTAASGTPLTAEVTGLTWTTCKLGTIPCTVATEHLNYKGTLEWTSGSDGSMTVSELGTNGAPGAHVLCESGGIKWIDCSFNESSLAGSVIGGFTEGAGTPVGEVSFSEVALTRTGGVCPKESKWTAHYKLTKVVEGKTTFNQVWVKSA